MKKLRVIASKGARELVLLRGEDFRWLLEQARAAGQEISVDKVSGQLQAINDNSSLLVEQQL